MSYGLNNQWLPQATYSLAYISSTADNEGVSGPYISTPAVFGQSANGTTDAYDDGDSYSWFQYKYPNVTMSRNTSTGAWESDGSASLFEDRVLNWCGVQAYGKRAFDVINHITMIYTRPHYLHFSKKKLA